MITDENALLLENDPKLIDKGRAVLLRAGYNVDHAASGEDGLRAVAHEKPSIIVVNLRLDPVSGLDFLTLLPYVTDNRQTYIIAVDDNSILAPDMLEHYGVNEVVHADRLEERLTALIGELHP